MAKLENTRKAYERGELWPIIADALETFLRRRTIGAEPYELIWRLIHIWESTSITLAAAAISRTRGNPVFDQFFLRCREYCYGRNWDKVNKQFKTSQGALQGSIDQWIDVLWELSKIELQDGFLAALKQLLDAEKINLIPLVQAWNRACDIPPDARRDTLTVKQAMRHVNTFRNRFAHVPFPHDPLSEIAEALEQATEELFSVQPFAWQFPDDCLKSPLMGGLFYKGHVIRGGNMAPFPSNEPSSERIKFVYPGTKRGNVPQESWDASPFVHIDQMMRPHILTRLKDESVGTWEYTRFRAEANALATVDDDKRMSDLPAPSSKEKEYKIDEDQEAAAEELINLNSDNGSTAEPAAQSFDEAIEALRTEDYDRAIPFFENLTKQKPLYHIAPLRLGVALREKANRLSDEKRELALTLLQQAISALGRATGHVDPDYQGQAYYERSKAYFHLAFLGQDDESARLQSVRDATKACALSSDPKFHSWLEYLERRGFIGEPATSKLMSV